MTLLKRAGTAALVAAAFALGASVTTLPVNAAPAGVGAANGRTLVTDSNVINVQDRRYRHGGGRDWHRGRHHGDHDWNPGAYIGLGIAGAILSGALSDGAYADDYGYADGPGYGEGSSAAMQRCASQFRSFEWDTGLYTTYEGEKRLCPYLG